jgi:hypothetical protein
LEKHARGPQIFLKFPLENLKIFYFFYFFDIIIFLLNILGCVWLGQVGLTSGLTDLASLFFKLGWTRPSHLSWAGTGPARLNRVGPIGGPTYFAFFFLGLHLLAKSTN